MVSVFANTIVNHLDGEKIRKFGQEWAWPKFQLWRHEFIESWLDFVCHMITNTIMNHLVREKIEELLNRSGRVLNSIYDVKNLVNRDWSQSMTSKIWRIMIGHMIFIQFASCVYIEVLVWNSVSLFIKKWV